jgi:hypothetical protein
MFFSLPNYHRDSFDHMIITQAQLEKLPILTSDSLIAQYKVKTIWASLKKFSNTHIISPVPRKYS